MTSSNSWARPTRRKGHLECHRHLHCDQIVVVVVVATQGPKGFILVEAAEGLLHHLAPSAPRETAQLHTYKGGGERKATPKGCTSESAITSTCCWVNSGS